MSQDKEYVQAISQEIQWSAHLSGLSVNSYGPSVRYVKCTNDSHQILSAADFERFEQTQRLFVVNRQEPRSKASLMEIELSLLILATPRGYSQSLSRRRRGLLSTLSLTVHTVTLYSLPGVNPTNVTLVSGLSSLRSSVVLFASLIRKRYRSNLDD